MRRPSSMISGLTAAVAVTAGMAADPPALTAAQPTVEVSFTQATEANGTTAAGRTIAAVGLRAAGVDRPAGPCDVVLLVDTSASQIGEHRLRALEAVSRMVGGTAEQGRTMQARFRVAAIDVALVPLSDAFAAGGSAANKQAMKRLDDRTPLGSTDLVEGLLAAVNLFDGSIAGGEDAGDDGAAAARRRIIYVGDGPGLGGVDADAFRELLETLRAERIGFSAVGIGDRVNWPCLAAIANATGGMLAVPESDASAAEAGGRILAMATGPVLWPDDVVISSESHDVAVRMLPERLPPLRTDRDTVVLFEGTLEKGRIEMSLVAEGGRARRIEVAIPPVAPKSDNAYLAELVRNASTTRGIFLPTLGLEGLDLSRMAVRQEAASLAALGRQAEAVGARDAAVRLADASLRRDPDNAEAAMVRTAASRPEGRKIAMRRAADEANPFDEPQDVGNPAVVEELPPRRQRAGSDSADGTVADGTDPTADELLQSEKMRRVRAGRLEQETAVRLRDARMRFSTDPAAAATDLRDLLQEVLSSDDLDAGLRDRLRRQVEIRIREADVRSREKAQRDLDAEKRRAAAREKLELVDDLNRREQRFKALADRYHSLVEEGIRVGYQRPTEAFMEAERKVALGPDGLAETAPNLYASPGMPMTARVVARTAPIVARILDYDAENTRVRRDQERGFMDTLHLVDAAAIPLSGEPPIVYPSAARWREITRLREKYKSVDLANPGTAEKRIYDALDKPVEGFKFAETPLRDVVASIEDKQGIPVELDTRALEDAGLDLETAVTKDISNVSLRSALRLLLTDLDLTYIIKDEVLLITTKEKAGENLVVKVYPVADLVLPINPQSGINPFQMGGGLGGAGSVNSGMGGGMGGVGGMGGMGGMGGGGMGGGMFQIADARARLAPGDGASTSKTKTADEGLPNTVLASDDLRAGVSAYLRQADGPAELEKRLAHVRRSALDLGERQSFAKAAELISGAIVAGHAEPWMYEALATAAEAAGWKREEIDRILLSSADFATSPTELMALAQYLAKTGSAARAIGICKRVVRLEPRNREAFALAMTLAAKEQDVRALQWSCAGVLAHDWPAGQQQIATRAARLAKITIEKLASEGRRENAAAFRRAVDEALVRDLEFSVTWGGDAEIDMIVEEPTGATCSRSAPRSTSGGMLLGDADGTSEHTERYVCSEAFPGTYRILVRRVWGNVEADTISAEMVMHRGTKREERVRKKLTIGTGDLLMNVNVPEGRRREPLDDATVAQDVVAQAAIGRSVLAQQLAGLNNAAAAASLAASRSAGQSGPTAGLPFFRQGAVGYQPQVSTLPEGVNMFARAVISADRRYVRVTTTPLFSSVGQITSFSSTGGGAGAGGAGAGGAGAGGAGGMGAGGMGAGGMGAGGMGAGGMGAGGMGAGGMGAGGMGAGGMGAGGMGAGGAF